MSRNFFYFERGLCKKILNDQQSMQSLMTIFDKNAPTLGVNDFLEIPTRSPPQITNVKSLIMINMSDIDIQKIMIFKVLNKTNIPHFRFWAESRS